ncbi:hypothetical protein [uncultured Chryseobacterium sp.]|nr:hypothetical protein [uncultured Chryseobacterium sp.]
MMKREAVVDVGFLMLQEMKKQEPVMKRRPPEKKISNAGEI